MAGKGSRSFAFYSSRASLSVGFFSSGNLFLPEQCLPVCYCGLRLPYTQSSVLAICLGMGWLGTSSGDKREL